MKRSILSILLIVVMLIGSMPLSVLAEGNVWTTSQSGEYGQFMDGEQVLSDMIAKNGEKAHPRIIMTAERFDKLKGSIGEDSVTGTLMEKLRAEADRLLKSPVSEYNVADGIRLLETSKRIQRRVAALAMAYNIFGEEEYATRCYAELEAACGFKDWNPSHFLDTAEMSTAFALGYDWLYHWMSEDQRALLRENMIEKGLKQGMEDYEDKPRERTYKWYQDYPGDNWKLVCNGGMSLSALAIGDEADAKEIAADVLTYAYKEAYSFVRRAYSEKDGTYTEGLGYWDYATYYLGLFSSALKSTTGQDYGLADYEGLRKSVDFVRYMSSNTPKSFSFGDDGDSRDTGWAVLLWLAENYKSYDIAIPRLKKIEGDSFNYLDYLWIDEEKPLGSVVDISTDWGEVGASNASFRNTWDESGIVAALHAGLNNYKYHGHYDLGTFYIEYNGARFFTDLGNEDYELSNRKYSYRIKAEGHNTLVINPSEELDQKEGAECLITDYAEGNEAYAVTDLTAAYEDSGAKSVQRGLKMIKDKECVIIQDEISLNAPGEIYWFAHTKGQIAVAADERSAVVTVGSDRLWVGLLSSVGSFSVMDAELLPTSPDVPGQTDNSEYRKLAIHLTDIRDTTISVACIPLKSGETKPFWTPSVQELSAWDLEEQEKEPATSWKFDFGNAGVEEGYIGVSAEEAYVASVGYGFAKTDAVENVLASGTGALADAVKFKSGVPGHVFNMDLPSGVYKIKVTTGDVKSTTITAEGKQQLFFLTGNNATDSFSIPVTDGQLNIYAGSGVGTEFSISALEIEQISTGTTTKPTIWIGGDSIAASFYNVPEDAKHGWGQYLCNYVDTDKYDVRNISASGVKAGDLKKSLFPTIEHYGKSGDILILALGVNDYTHQHKDNPDAPDPTEYIANMTDMVQRAKAKGMTVYLVKQHGMLSDCSKYPVLTSRWFGEELETIAASENVGIIDLFSPWLELCMEQTARVTAKYYTDDKLHLNALGADLQASMVKEQLFPMPKPDEPQDPYRDFDNETTVFYETEVSGGPVVNPHKGYVMTVYDDWVFESINPYGIGGSMNNTAWEMSTICSGEPKWDELNPAEGVYDWSSIDSMLVACEKYGYTYGIRILPYSHLSGSHDNYGADHVFVPDWVFEKGAQMDRATLYSDPSVELDIPKWDDPIFLQAAKDFAKALAEKYDGDPRVEFIDISVFGNWGEWHTSTFIGNPMPSEEIQKDMIKYYSDVFDKTWLCVTSGAYGEVYDYSRSLGIPKRVNGLIGSHNNEWNLRPNYYDNLPVIGENFLPYKMMLDPDKYAQGIVNNYDEAYLRWTPQRFRETIEISHLSIYAFDQDSKQSYEFYNEQRDLIREMNNRLGYNFTVTSAKRNENQLLVTIKNTGLAPAFFNIELAAEITDAKGNKLGNFGAPVLIGKGTFSDNTEKTFLFEYNGALAEDTQICLAMYDCDNYLVADKGPTIKFDNKNTLSDNRLLLLSTQERPGDVPPGWTESDYVGCAIEDENGLWQLTLTSDHIMEDTFNLPAIQKAVSYWKAQGKLFDVICVEENNTKNPVIDKDIFGALREVLVNSGRLEFSYCDSRKGEYDSAGNIIKEPEEMVAVWSFTAPEEMTKDFPGKVLFRLNENGETEVIFSENGYQYEGVSYCIAAKQNAAFHQEVLKPAFGELGYFGGAESCYIQLYSSDETVNQEARIRYSQDYEKVYLCFENVDTIRMEEPNVMRRITELDMGLLDMLKDTILTVEEASDISFELLEGEAGLERVDEGWKLTVTQPHISLKLLCSYLNANGNRIVEIWNYRTVKGVNKFKLTKSFIKHEWDGKQDNAYKLNVAWLPATEYINDTDCTWEIVSGDSIQLTSEYYGSEEKRDGSYRIVGYGDTVVKVSYASASATCVVRVLSPAVVPEIPVIYAVSQVDTTLADIDLNQIVAEHNKKASEGTFTWENPSAKLAGYAGADYIEAGALYTVEGKNPVSVFVRIERIQITDIEIGVYDKTQKNGQYYVSLPDSVKVNEAILLGAEIQVNNTSEEAVETVKKYIKEGRLSVKWTDREKGELVTEEPVGESLLAALRAYMPTAKGKKTLQVSLFAANSKKAFLTKKANLIVTEKDVFSFEPEVFNLTDETPGEMQGELTVKVSAGNYGNAKKLTFKSEDTSVLKLGKITTEYTDVLVTFTIPYTFVKAGKTTLSVTASDEVKTSKGFAMECIDDTPKLSQTVVTFDKGAMEQKTKLMILTHEDAPLKGNVTIKEAAQAENFALTAAEGAYVFSLRNSSLAKGTYDVTLAGTYQRKDGEEKQFECKLKVTVKDTKIKPTVKQKRALNVFYKSGESVELNTKLSKGNLLSFEIADVNSPFAMEYVEKNKYRIWLKESFAETDLTAEQKEITFAYKVGAEGECYAGQMTYVLKTVKKAPKVTGFNAMKGTTGEMYTEYSITSLFYAPELSDGAKISSFEEQLWLVDVTGKSVTPVSSVGKGEVVTIGKNNYYIYSQAYAIVVELAYPDAAVKGTDVIKLRMKDAGWNGTVDFTIKNKVNTGKAKVTLSQSTIVMNTNEEVYLYENYYLRTKVGNCNCINASNMSGRASEIIPVDKKSKDAMENNLFIRSDFTSVTIKFYDRGEKASGSYLKPGTYKYKVKTEIGNQDVTYTFKVKIVDVAPSKMVKVSKKGTIDVLDRENTYTTLQVKTANGLLNQEFTDFYLEGTDSALFDVRYDSETKTGRLYAKEGVQLSAKQNYRVIPVCKYANGLELKGAPVTIRVKQGGVKIRNSVKEDTLYVSKGNALQIEPQVYRSDEWVAVKKVELLNYTDDLKYENGILCFRTEKEPTAILKSEGVYTLKFAVTLQEGAADQKQSVFTCKVRIVR